MILHYLRRSPRFYEVAAFFDMTESTYEDYTKNVATLAFEHWYTSFVISLNNVLNSKIRSIPRSIFCTCLHSSNN